MPWMEVEKDYRLRGSGRPGEPARPLRRAPPADRLPRLLWTGGHDLHGAAALSGAGVRGLLVHRRPDRAPGPPERARHDARVRLARAAGRDPGLEGALGLGLDPLVHDHRRLRHGLRRRRWHGTNAFIRDGDRIFRTYFIDGRGDEHLGTTWSYLDMTALGRQEEWEDSPEGYPQTPAVRVVELSRRVRRNGPGRVAGRSVVIAHIGGVPLEEILPAAGRRGRRAAGRPRLDNCAAATPTGAPGMTSKTTVRMRAHLPGTGRRGSSTPGPARR